MKTDMVKLIFAAMLLAGCSVKENREDCPAWCVVASDGYVADNYHGRLLCNLATSVRTDYGRSREDFERFERRGDLLFEVPRRETVWIDVFSGVRGMSLKDTALLISRGHCCDSVYSGHSSVFVENDEVETMLPLNKDFATMLLKISGLDNRVAYFFRLTGNVDGYCIPGGRPHSGEFVYSEKIEEGVSHSVRLPRQKDDSLLLEIICEEDGSVATSQPLGKAIAALGYDWTSADLRDFGIGIDIREAKFSIMIEAWDGSRTININL
jgi:hypothetical protein